MPGSCYGAVNDMEREYCPVAAQAVVKSGRIIYGCFTDGQVDVRGLPVL